MEGSVYGALCDHEAELFITAILAERRDIRDSILARLTPEDFDHAQARKAFEVISSLHESGNPIDPTSVMVNQEIREHISQNEDRQAYMNAALFDPNAEHVSMEATKELAHRVRELHKKRLTFLKLHEAVESLKSKPLEEVCIGLVQELEASNEKRDSSKIVDLIGQWGDEIKQAIRDGKEVFYRTRIEFLDSRLNIRRGSVSVFSAREKTGKTWFMQQLALAAVNSKEPVAWYSTEMGYRDMIPRLVASLTRHGWIMNETPRSIEDFEQVLADLYGKVLQQAPFHFQFSSSAIDMFADMTDRVRNDGVSVFVVDYMQDMATPESWGKEKHEKIGALIRRLKDFAQRHDVVVLAVSSLTKAQRGEEYNSPETGQLYGSTQIGFTADNIVMMWRPLKDREDVVAFKITSSRNSKDRQTWYTIRDSRTFTYEEISSDVFESMKPVSPKREPYSTYY